MATLLLFTQSYPFRPGEEFLETEIDYLAREFKNVKVLPRRLGNDQRELPHNVELRTDFATRISSTRGYAAIAVGGIRHIGLLANELIVRENRIRLAARMVFIVSTWLEICSKAGILAGILRDLSSESSEPLMAYTYWFTSVTYALAALNQPLNITLVTRCHGFDVFPERSPAGFFPMRRSVAHGISRIFPCSDIGGRVLKEQVPSIYHDRIETSRLGVCPASCRNELGAKNVIHVVSCSYAVPEKRLDLMRAGIIRLALKLPTMRVRWSHIGGGPCIGIVQQAEKVGIGNLQIVCIGPLENAEVLEFYEHNSTDVFVNCSESEGIPVSIMEAMSFGIPVVATAVGGTPEIVNNKNGRLLPRSPEPEVIADAVVEVVSARESKRTEAFLTWQKKFNAENNYKTFACTLRASAEQAF